MSAMKAHALDATDVNGWIVDADLLGGCSAMRFDDVAAPAVDAAAVAELQDGARAAFAAQGFADAGPLVWSVSFQTVGGRVVRTFTTMTEGA